MSGVQTCHSVWSCPVCAAKITERRRVELQNGLDSWKGQGYRVVMVTYTLRHQAGEGLGAVLARLTDARRGVWAGKGAKTLRGRLAIVGSVRGLEVTYGANGWHPHVHELLFVQSNFIDGIALQEWLSERWGRLADCDRHGVDVRFADVEVANYVAKFGKESQWDMSAELTKQGAKLGRAGSWCPLGLLAAYVEEPTAQAEGGNAGQLWREFASAMKGKRQLYWSHLMRGAVGLGNEQSDAEIAAAVEESGVLLARLDVRAWRVVVDAGLRHELLARAGLGDGEALVSWLRCTLMSHRPAFGPASENCYNGRAWDRITTS